MFPTLSEAVTGERLTVGPPFFNKWMVPIGLMLLFLTGVGPLLAWRKSTLSNLRDQFLWPVASRRSSPAALVSRWACASGRRASASRSAPSSLGTIVQEFWRGAGVRRRSTGTDLFTALVGLVGRNKRRYGGYIVHVGIVLMFLASPARASSSDEQVLLKPGQQIDASAATRCGIDALKVTDDGQKQMITAHITVFEDGKRDRRRCTRRAGSSASTRRADHRGRDPPDVRRGPLPRAADVRRRGPDGEPARSSSTRWSTGSGSASASWRSAPASRCCRSARSRSRWRSSRRPRRRPRRACSLLLLALRGACARAAHRRRGGSVPVALQSPLERELQREIVCMCGTCGRKNLAECTCSKAAEMRAELAGLVEAGQDPRRRSFSTSSPSTAARSRSRRRSTRASTGSPGSSRTPSAGSPRSAARSSSGSGRGARTTTPQVPQQAAAPAEDAAHAGAPRPRARKPRLVPCLQRNRRPIPYGRGSSSRSARWSARRPPSSSFAARAPRTSSSSAWPSSRPRWSALRRCMRCARSRRERRASRRWSAATPAPHRARKELVLRSIKELEFDRAMGKVGEPTTKRWSARLRSRAVRLMQQLDNTSSGYRELIERELASGWSKRVPRRSLSRPADATADRAERQAQRAGGIGCRRRLSIVRDGQRRRREVLQIVRHQVARVAARLPFYFLLFTFYFRRSRIRAAPDAGPQADGGHSAAGHRSARRARVGSTDSRSALQQHSRASRSRYMPAGKSITGEDRRERPRGVQRHRAGYDRQRRWRQSTASASSRRSFPGRAKAASA